MISGMKSKDSSNENIHFPVEEECLSMSKLESACMGITYTG